jgi:hypothetical protein
LFVPIAVGITISISKVLEGSLYTRFHNALKIIQERKRYVLSAVCGEKDRKPPIHGKRTVGAAALGDASNKNVRTDLRENEGSTSSRAGGTGAGPGRRGHAHLGTRPDNTEFQVGCS